MLAPPTNTNPACTACGYDLAGLKLPGKCPECGGWNEWPRMSTPVALAPIPAWLRWTRLVWFVASLTSIVLVMQVENPAPGSGPRPIASLLSVIGWTLLVCGLILTTLLAGFGRRVWPLTAVMVILFLQAMFMHLPGR